MEKLILNVSDIFIRLGTGKDEYVVITSIDDNYNYSGTVYHDLKSAKKKRKELLSKMDTMIY